MPKVAHNLAATYVFRFRERVAELLLIRRAAGDLFGGTWSTVYGEIHDGETAVQAALREMREETGLVPTAFYQLNTVASFYLADQDTIYHYPAFAAEVDVDARVRLNEEHDAFDWVEPEAAMQRLIWPGQRQIVREIVAEILTPSPAIEFLRIAL